MVDSKIVELTFVLIPSLTCICHGKNRAFFYGLTGSGGGGGGGAKTKSRLAVILRVHQDSPTRATQPTRSHYLLTVYKYGVIIVR